MCIQHVVRMVCVQPTVLALSLPVFAPRSPVFPVSDWSLSFAAVFFVGIALLDATSSEPSGAPSVDVGFYLAGILIPDRSLSFAVEPYFFVVG